VHSHEEDTETAAVYRPADYDFPLSRGREAFELQADGTLLDSGIGPADRPEEEHGTWKVDEDRLVLATPGRKRVMKVRSVDDDRLVVEEPGQ
jgi:hypothetical protein